jgi:hypothetical protein
LSKVQVRRCFVSSLWKMAMTKEPRAVGWEGAAVPEAALPKRVVASVRISPQRTPAAFHSPDASAARARSRFLLIIMPVTRVR